MHKVILVDDHHLFLQGITAVLNEIDGVTVAGVAGNGYEALDIIALHQPQLVIFDLNMPKLDGIQLLKRIKKDFPGIKTLVVTGYQNFDLVEEIKNNKADGFLNKSSTSNEVKTAVLTVLGGNKYFPEGKQVSSNTDLYFTDDFLKKLQITRREVEIIRLLCGGKSSKEIAQILFLSEFTISTHRKNILRKIGSKNMVELMIFAKENNLI